MQEVIERLTDEIDRATAPGRMSKEDALKVLEELTVQLDGRSLWPRGAAAR